MIKWINILYNYQAAFGGYETPCKKPEIPISRKINNRPRDGCSVVRHSLA